MRSPLTGVVFALELTHAWPLLLPLLIAATAAYTVSALLLKRSVLTEKVARRGFHLTREYAVDPLEVLFVDEVMHTTPIVAEARNRWPSCARGPTCAASGCTRWWPSPRGCSGSSPGASSSSSTAAGARGRRRRPATGADRVPRRDAAQLARRFAPEHVTTAVVVSRADPTQIVGLITVEDLLQGHLRDLLYERQRERVLQPRKLLIPRAPRRSQV